MTIQIDPKHLHRFEPSRPGGTVCIVLRSGPPADPDYAEPCGYPEAHPIHAEPVAIEAPAVVTAGPAPVRFTSGERTEAIVARLQDVRYLLSAVDRKVDDGGAYAMMRDALQRISVTPGCASGWRSSWRGGTTRRRPY